MNRGHLLVYLSGPITGSDHGTVQEHAIAGLEALLACTRLGIPAICPQLTGAFPAAWAVSWEQWMAVDLALVEHCTHVLMLPGWETSRGARQERTYALRIGTPVVYDLEALTDVEPAGAGV
jgi:hypothetical protein